jgi:hypothetical protein
MIISLADSFQQFVVGIQDLRGVDEPYLYGSVLAVMVVTVSRNLLRFRCSKILLQNHPHLVSLGWNETEKEKIN